MSREETSADETEIVRGSTPGVDKLIEIIAVLLLGITTLGTAWCGYQATQWGGRNSDLSQKASEQTVESSRLFGLAAQTISYDAATLAQYAQAVSEGDRGLQKFYRASLIRKPMLPLIDRWQREIRAGQAPVPLTEDKVYLATQLKAYHESLAKVGELSAAGRAAGAAASAYVAVTILLAVALFFAGVVSSFRYRAARVMLLAASLATLGVAASRLASLPTLF